MTLVSKIIKLVEVKDSFGSFLMKSFLRMSGAKIGRNTYISFSSRIAARRVVIGNDCRILSHVKIKTSSFELGNGCILSEQGYYTGKSSLQIGNKTYIGKKVRINVSDEVKIGNDVGIGENTTIWTHGYFPPADEGFPVTYKPVAIHDGAWVSTNIIILPGVVINAGTIIGAGAVVTKTFPDNSLIAGNPAKLLKSTDTIKSDRDFLEIMRDIFDQYDFCKLIEQGQGFLKYQYRNSLMYVLQGDPDLDFASIDQRKSIVIIKNLRNRDFFVDKEFDWIDLSMDKRLVRNTKNKDLKSTLSLLREWGIRVEVDYE